MENICIELKNISKSFKNETILKNINAYFQGGHIYGIVGKNGIGKTLIFKMMCGFMMPSAGEILVCNTKLRDDTYLNIGLGVVLENTSLIQDYSAFKNLKYLTKLQHNVSDAQIYEALRQVGLDPASKKRFRKFSLGMKQKLLIAQAIFEDPSIVILDEAFNGVDNESVENISKLLINLKDNGKLILLSSHIKDEIMDLCDAVYEVHNDALVVQNTSI